MTAVHPDAQPRDIVSPGHIFPLRARQGGGFGSDRSNRGIGRSGPAGRTAPGGVICEVMKETAPWPGGPDLEVFAQEHDLKIVSIADLIAYRLRHESFVTRAAEAAMPTLFGEFTIAVYTNEFDDHQHVALIKGEIKPDEPVLVRVHSECLTGDVFGPLRCDCGDQLHSAMQVVEKEGKGVILYLHQEAGESAWPIKSRPTPSRSRVRTRSRPI